MSSGGAPGGSPSSAYGSIGTYCGDARAHVMTAGCHHRGARGPPPRTRTSPPHDAGRRDCPSLHPGAPRHRYFMTEQTEQKTEAPETHAAAPEEAPLAPKPGESPAAEATPAEPEPQATGATEPEAPIAPAEPVGNAPEEPTGSEPESPAAPETVPADASAGIAAVTPPVEPAPAEHAVGATEPEAPIAP